MVIRFASQLNVVCTLPIHSMQNELHYNQESCVAPGMNGINPMSRCRLQRGSVLYLDWIMDVSVP